MNWIRQLWNDTLGMKLSWSHKLFFKTNRLLGRSKFFDALVRFWAEYAVFYFGLGVLISFWSISQDWDLFLWLVSQTGFLLISGIFVSFIIAWLWPHSRPKVEFPEIRELITPLSHWKSLPSDHSLIAWILAITCLQFTTPGLVISLVVIIIAASIAIARVFAGVHYPRDVIAGMVLAMVLSYLFFLL